MRWFWRHRYVDPEPTASGARIEAREALRDSDAKLRDADRLERRARRARRRTDLLAEDLRRAMGPT